MSAFNTDRDTRQALWRGAGGRCPCCGTGRLFRGYLAVAEHCGDCGAPLGAYRAADGPAFFTISIVGILLVPLLGLTFVFFRPEPATLLAVVALVATALTFALLRLVKGAFVAYLWAQRMEDPGA